MLCVLDLGGCTFRASRYDRKIISEAVKTTFLTGWHLSKTLGFCFGLKPSVTGVKEELKS